MVDKEPRKGPKIFKLKPKVEVFIASFTASLKDLAPWKKTPQLIKEEQKNNQPFLEQLLQTNGTKLALFTNSN